MAYDRKKDFEEPLAKTLADIKSNQDAVAKKFELLIAFMSKVEECIDLELEDKEK
jgi:hypothetical protein